MFVYVVCKINKIRWQEAIRKSEPIGKNKKTIRQTKSTNYYSEPFCFSCTNEAGTNFILITKKSMWPLYFAWSTDASCLTCDCFVCDFVKKNKKNHSI